ARTSLDPPHDLRIGERSSNPYVGEGIINAVGRRTRLAGQLVRAIELNQRVEREELKDWIGRAVCDGDSRRRIDDRVAYPATPSQAARPGDQPECLVLRASARATLFDAVGCRGNRLVEGVSGQREFSPGLSQAKLPQPLMPAGGAGGGRGGVRQQS